MLTKKYVIVGINNKNELIAFRGFRASSRWKVKKYITVIGSCEDLFKTCRHLNKKTPDIKWNVYRVGSKKCPIKLNWEHFYKNNSSHRGDYYKYLLYAKK
jgi:hypothetical protein